ncbi:MAG: amidohydrolase, partial [Sarcina sp.]
MPSFIDPHSHITAVATSLNIVNLQGTTTFDEIIEKIKDFIVKNNIKKGQWISGFGFDENFLKEKTYPTKDVLDKASKDNPILIAHASGHTGIANSLALKEFNITSDTKDPEGGVISRISGANEPDGHLEENAFFMYGAKIPKAIPEVMMKSIEKAQDLYLSYGITTIQDGLTSDHDFKVLKYSSDNKNLKVDVISYIDIANYKSVLDENKDYTKDYINRFKIGGYKVILDGSPQARTAWLTKPYENAKDGYCGFPHCTDKQVIGFVKTALNENMQLLAHCNGDAASDQFINSFKTVFNSGIYSKETRPVMIHAQTVRYDQIDEMKQINMLPSYFIAHVYHWGDVHIKNLGMERASRISPAKTTLKKEVSFTFHEDSPVILPNMLETVWCAVN